MDKELFRKVETLQNLLLDRATGKYADENLYHTLRTDLCQNSILKNKLPDFLFTNRTLPQFWQFIKSKYGNYADRRQFLWESFSVTLNHIETFQTSPVAQVATAKLSRPDQQHINNEWKKALARKQDDPEGAITTSRTLIETVCKYILDELNVDYDESVDLPKLYKFTAQNLNLAPEQHNEEIFKQILRGCQTVVDGLGALRNKLSDSHGKKKSTIRPGGRHAELAVNLAGSMATFLLDTFEARK